MSSALTLLLGEVDDVDPVVGTNLRRRIRALKEVEWSSEAGDIFLRRYRAVGAPEPTLVARLADLESDVAALEAALRRANAGIPEPVPKLNLPYAHAVPGIVKCAIANCARCREKASYHTALTR